MTAAIVAATLVLGFPQDRLPTMPGYDGYVKANENRRQMTVNRFSPRWISGTRLEFTDTDGKRIYNVETDRFEEASASILPDPAPQPQQAPARGRQFTETKSANGGLVARYEDGNITLSGPNGKSILVTTEGDLEKRIKYGNASWVYGEELGQRDAMGFSPDSKFLWYYRFDERPVSPFFITTNHRGQVVELDVEAYPKPGMPNPVVDLYVYDVAANKSTRIKVRPGAFNNGLGHYVYAITWMPDSSELLFHRMDRRQKVRELCAANPRTGEIRVIDRYDNPDGWVDYGPIRDERRAVGTRWLVSDDRDGFENLAWLDLKSGTRTPITRHQADVARVVQVNESKNQLFYMLGDGATPYMHQLYSAKADGSDAKRLTDPRYHHAVTLSPDSKWIADIYESDSVAPRLRIISAADGSIKRELSDESLSEESKKAGSVEWIKFRSLDDTVDLYMQVHLPADHAPGKRLPVLFSVYGGPGGGTGPTQRYQIPNALTGAGFAVVELAPRGGSGRGRAFRQAIYRKLGRIEIDDMAAAAQELSQFDWADTERVGIYGTSYGGYASAMAILRYPDLFQAAVASSMVSDWRNYDTTYTERYMDLLEENKEGYDFGSAMTHAGNLKGWLMLYFGTADNNTHPSNTYQLSSELSRKGKFFELQAGVDQGHTGLNSARMLEFFIERLVITGPRSKATGATTFETR